jgi:DNA-binding transcriptional LysR family regulator
VDHALASRGITVESRMTFGSTEAVKRAVAVGAGIAFVSRVTLGLEREAGRLVVIELTDFEIRRPLHRLRARGRHDSRAATAFLTRMQRSLGSRAWKAYQRI